MAKLLIHIKQIPIYGIAIINFCVFSAVLMAQEKGNKESKNSEASKVEITLPAQVKQEKGVIQEINIQLATPVKQDSAVVLEMKIEKVAPLITKQTNQPTIELKLEPLPTVDVSAKDTSSVPEVIELKIVPLKKEGKTQDKKEVQELKLQPVKPKDASANSQKESKNK